jgi:hypothetical protein
VGGFLSRSWISCGRKFATTSVQPERSRTQRNLTLRFDATLFSKVTPHPPFGHLLPHGGEGKEGQGGDVFNISYEHQTTYEARSHSDSLPVVTSANRL